MKNLVPTLQEIDFVYTCPQLMLNKEISSVDCEDHVKNTNTLHGQNTLSSVIAGGIYNNHCALRDLSTTKTQQQLLPLLDGVFLTCTLCFSIYKEICQL
jgi:hypothetical protein